MTTTAAERDVKAAEAKLAQVKQQLQELDEQIERERSEASEIESAIRGKHEAGEPVSADDRRRKREALADVKDLIDERGTIEGLISKRQEELRAAHVGLAVMRASELEAEAELLGAEAWDAIAVFAEIWEKIRAVEAAHHQQTSTARHGGYKEPLGGGILQRVGLENHKRRISDLLADVRPELAQRLSA